MRPLWSVRRLTVISPVQPVLRAALIGYDPEQEFAAATALAACTALGAQWQLAPTAGADVWLVSPHVQLQVRSHRLHLRFDTRALDTLPQVLDGLAPWLARKVVEQALVAHLIANAGRRVRRGVVEVVDASRCLAVIDFGGDTAIAPTATPEAIHRAQWLVRAAGADMPWDFPRVPTEEVLWRFGTRCRGMDLLPARYLRLPVHLRRVPVLPGEDVSDTQAAIVGELSRAPRTLRELRERLGAGEATLRTDLGALHLVGAITTDPARALVKPAPPARSRTRPVRFRAADPSAPRRSAGPRP